MLIVGESGAGKSSLLKAAAGLWHWGSSGIIRRDMEPRGVLFLPQRPYMSLGSLRDQLTYPLGLAQNVDLDDVLRRVGLQTLLDRLNGNIDSVRRWDEELSLGEQQRLSIARVLVQRPSYVILDEATSANDLRHEACMYECIRDTCKGYVSVGHRQSIAAFHKQQLRLLGDQGAGKWELEAL